VRVVLWPVVSWAAWVEEWAVEWEAVGVAAWVAASEVALETELAVLSARALAMLWLSTHCPLSYSSSPSAPVTKSSR